MTLMANTRVAIKLRAAEHRQLEQWESSHGTPQQVALRCRIVLGAAAGEDNMAIAEALGVSRPTVQRWRKRVAEQGIGEVWEIAPGRGRKPRYDQATREAIIAATLRSKPAGMTHWSCRRMAEAQEMAAAQYQAAPEPHLQAVAGCEIPGEADRCGGAVFEPARQGAGVVPG